MFCVCVQQERRLSDELTRPSTLPHPRPHNRTQQPSGLTPHLSERRSESQPQLNGIYIQNTASDNDN